MKKARSEPSAQRLLKEATALETLADADIDTSDAPEIADWSSAVRAKFYRPVKQLLSVRVDADVVAWFKASGEGYQTRMNAALREYVENHSRS